MKLLAYLAVGLRASSVAESDNADYSGNVKNI